MNVLAYETNCVLEIMNLNTMLSHVLFISNMGKSLVWNEPVFYSLPRMIMGKTYIKWVIEIVLAYCTCIWYFFCHNYVYARSYVFLYLNCRIKKQYLPEHYSYRFISFSRDYRWWRDLVVRQIDSDSCRIMHCIYNGWRTCWARQLIATRVCKSFHGIIYIVYI